MRALLQRLGQFLGRKRNDKEVWASVVLLLQTAPSLSDEALLAAARAAYRNIENVEIVGRLDNTRILRISSLLISVIIADAPYIHPSHPVEEASQSAYDRAWSEQRAWLSIDAPQTTGKPKEARMAVYKVLMVLAEHLWSDQCTGLYLPAEGITAPSMGEWGPTLRWFGENQERRRSETPQDFPS
ncbi:hypothetical protein [Paracidobacterium acidisoli]|uniref:Uncharacterized protein n=1 Tax=Paracidobacterium acidisoli TaxID=2303751 RepID=A0A372IPN2_9BACT|nr:hypothetical protein [Paracidobacterium acidisoli]MBT9331179.1 hypothetical protein [Paracidobacterium acidisoli]